MTDGPEVKERSAGLADGATLAAFAVVVLIGGLNFVGVRISNREFPPFYGAAARFLIASLLLFLVMGLRRVPFPKGKPLVGTLIYGVVGFAAFYAFAYWALRELPAGIASVIAGSVPLITLLLAVVHRVESFRMRGLVGAIVSICGIAILMAGPGKGEIAIGSLVAMLGAAVCAAESTVILKRFPPSHPIATNAVAMGSGGLLLLALSAGTGERWILPRETATLWSLGYLTIVGSLALFGLYLFVLKRWTASGVSFMFVLFPIVATVAGIFIADESLTSSSLVGGIVVLTGVYVGALSGTRPKERYAPPPEGCAPVEKSVLVASGSAGG